ncbi:aminotransferase class I/II-fold pyridoxal phosphate-dependent enzyme [Bacillaceae bacterium W0354]
MDQSRAPLFEAIIKHSLKNPVSFHVPGHKNGRILTREGAEVFSNILKYDLTELDGLDDLHQPEAAIQDAEQLAAELYGVERTFFLVNGSTAGNLAMILSVCQVNDQILVQRNSHKSLMHGLELAGARPIFFSPEFDEETSRYSNINVNTIKRLIEKHQHIKAIVLTYPDYFGSTYDLKSIVQYAHEKNIPVLVDEAHGAHFVLGDPFPKSAIDCGADLVVHSAHKTLPAMTMGSYLHFQSKLIHEKTVRTYLQMIQSSSPSYPIMASLDLARKYIASFNQDDKERLLNQINRLRFRLEEYPIWELQRIRYKIDDPLKMTLTSKDFDMRNVETWLNEERIYPEMVQNNQLLLIAGLQLEDDVIDLFKQLKNNVQASSFKRIHGTMAQKQEFYKDVYELPFDYHSLQSFQVEWMRWDEAIGEISAATVIPYPPGIPVLLKGEKIEKSHVEYITNAINEDKYIQYHGQQLASGIEVFRIE